MAPSPSCSLLPLLPLPPLNYLVVFIPSYLSGCARRGRGGTAQGAVGAQRWVLSVGGPVGNGMIWSAPSGGVAGWRGGGLVGRCGGGRTWRPARRDSRPRTPHACTPHAHAESAGHVPTSPTAGRPPQDTCMQGRQAVERRERRTLECHYLVCIHAKGTPTAYPPTSPGRVRYAVTGRLATRHGHLKVWACGRGLGEFSAPVRIGFGRGFGLQRGHITTRRDPLKSQNRALRPELRSPMYLALARPIGRVGSGNYYVNNYIISIRSSNFGWARPNRVVSQAVFQKIAAGHPKFGSEREVRSSPWEFSALIASRLDAPLVPKNPKGKRFSWPHRRAAHTGHTHRPAVPPPAPPAPRASEFTAPGRRAGLPNELHPKFKVGRVNGGSKNPENPSEV